MADEWVGNTAAVLERPDTGAEERVEALARIRGQAEAVAAGTGWELVEAARNGATYKAENGDLIRLTPGAPLFLALLRLSRSCPR